MRLAGFWARSGAYLIDVIPIVVLTGAVFYLFLGFNETLDAYFADSGNLEVRAQFLRERNWIRDSAFLVWLAYSVIMEASPLQGTFGKVVMRLRVVGPDGERLTLGRSAWRNFLKILSYIPLGLGFLWVAISKEKRAWHDTLAKTRVIHIQRGAQ